MLPMRDGRTDEQGKIELLSLWMDAGWLSFAKRTLQMERFLKKKIPKAVESIEEQKNIRYIRLTKFIGDFNELLAKLLMSKMTKDL